MQKSDRSILILQNCKIESAGLILPSLDAAGCPYQVVQTYADEAIPDLRKFSAVISLGCPESANDFSRIKFLGQVYRAVEQVLRLNLPYLGICCGAQLLALVLGAKVRSNEAKEIGASSVSLTKAGQEEPLFEGFEPEFPVFQWHGETFDIPAGGTLLATGSVCHNQAFRYKKAVGIQFHLEADLPELPIWCNTYQSELEEVAKTRKQVVSEYSLVADRLAELNTILLRGLVNEANSYHAE